MARRREWRDDGCEGKLRSTRDGEGRARDRKQPPGRFVAAGFSRHLSVRSRRRRSRRDTHARCEARLNRVRECESHERRVSPRVWVRKTFGMTAPCPSPCTIAERRENPKVPKVVLAVSGTSADATRDVHTRAPRRREEGERDDAHLKCLLRRSTMRPNALGKDRGRRRVQRQNRFDAQKIKKRSSNMSVKGVKTRRLITNVVTRSHNVDSTQR